MRVSWIGYLNPFVFSGGGELTQRALIEEGRRRGHLIDVAGFLQTRPQRALRRARVLRGLHVARDADLYVLADLRNAPHLAARIPDSVIEAVLGSGRAGILENAWVDVCPLDVPCHGDRRACPSTCDRSYADYLYSRAAFASFVSPRHRDLIASVIDVPLPGHIVLSRPTIDVDRFRPFGLERDIDVLYVGVVSRAKGYYNLLDRFGAARLTFAGRNMLGEAVAGTYLGEVSQQQLPELYNRARIFAHYPEWDEPMGRTVVEASLCGCEIAANERVGVTSYPDEDWRDRSRVRRNPARFWEDLEGIAAAL